MEVRNEGSPLTGQERRRQGGGYGSDYAHVSIYFRVSFEEAQGGGRKTGGSVEEGESIKHQKEGGGKRKEGV